MAGSPGEDVHEILDDDLLGLAAQLSYSLLGPVGSPEILTLMQDQMKRLANAESGGLLTFGVVGALWSSSAALVWIVDALNRAYDIEESRPWWKVRLTAIGLTFGLVPCSGSS